MSTYTYKIVLIGDAGVGKTTCLARHTQGTFDVKYNATMGVETNILSFSTNRGTVVFNVWDCAGQEKYSGLGDQYFTKADAALLFFDVTNFSTFANLPWWITSFEKVNPNSKIVICGNKCDQKFRKVMPNTIRNFVGSKYHYNDVSMKTNYNFDKPFLNLARKLTGYGDLFFVESPAIMPVEVKINIDPLNVELEQIEKKFFTELEVVLDSKRQLDVSIINLIRANLKRQIDAGVAKLIKEKDLKIIDLENQIKMLVDKNDDSVQNVGNIEYIQSLHGLQNDENLENNENLEYVERLQNDEKRKLVKLADNLQNDASPTNEPDFEDFIHDVLKSIRQPSQQHVLLAITEIWTLNKEQFIQKHGKSLDRIYLDFASCLYDLSVSEREKILLENDIYS